MAHRILIVDDSATTRAFLKRAISLAGVEATLQEAPHGKAALTLLASGGIDLVMTDLHMPEMGGEELVRALRANPATASMPVLVISADPSTDRGEQLRAIGVAGFVRKPFTPESIRDALAGVLAPGISPANGAASNA